MTGFLTGPVISSKRLLKKWLKQDYITLVRFQSYISSWKNVIYSRFNHQQCKSLHLLSATESS